MSGIEIVGVIAGSLQLAELGMKLSVKLCSFYRQIKDADHSAQRLATDVSLTCSILHQLGKTLEQDGQTKLCSQQAFLTAKEVLGECEHIFRQIDDAVEKKDPGSGKGRWERGTRRLTIVILGPDLDALKSHLDRLKSTMLLMLNVIMYARDISRYVFSCLGDLVGIAEGVYRTSDHSSLQAQRELIETLLREKTETEARLERLAQVASASSSSEGARAMSASTLIAQPGMATGQQSSVDSEIDKYYDLVTSLLGEIDTYQASLQQDRHLRIRNGVVDVHKTELDLFSHFHGPAAVQAFDSPFFQVRNAARGDYEMVMDQRLLAASHNAKLPTQSSTDSVPLPVRQSYGHSYRGSSMEDDSESDRPYRRDSTKRRSSQQIKRVRSFSRSRSRRPYHRPSYTPQVDFRDSRYRRAPRPERQELIQRPGRAYGPPKKARRSGKHGRESRRTSSGSRTYRDTSSVQPYDSDDDYNHHPYNYNSRRSRRRSRRRDSELDTYSTDDEDLRKYQREPSAPVQQLRRRRSSTASDHSPARYRNRNRLQWTPQGDPKPARERLHEEPANPAFRESVAPLKDARKTGVPPGMRLTKIARRVVNPEALEAGNEAFEKQPGFVIVRRALSKIEIQTYAVMTQEIRDQRHKDTYYTRNTWRNDSSEDASSGEDEDEDEDPDEQLKLKAPSTPEPKRSSRKSESSSHGGSTSSPSSSGKEGLEEHAASKTLEDLVLSWTTLSRDMIQ